MLSREILFRDTHGQTWKRLDKDYVQRVSDGSIGVWDSGKGLYPANNTQV